MFMKLYLIGLPGSGKSFLGKELAAALKISFIDLDAVIEREAARSIAQIFSEKGEAYFRSLEATALRQQSKNPDFVMACGGGTPCFHNNMQFINETGKSIFLNVPVHQIAHRLKDSRPDNRPLLKNAQSLESELNKLLEKRIGFYQQASATVEDAASLSTVVNLFKK